MRFDAFGRRRYIDAVIARQVALRFPSVAVHSDDPIAIRQLRAALGVVSLERASGNVWR